MKGRNQRGEFFRLDVLELVDEQRDRAAALPRRFADHAEQIGQVGLEIAGIGESRLGVRVDAYLHVLVFDPDPADEARQPAPCPPQTVPGRLDPVEREQGAAEFRRQQRRQGTSFGRFDPQADEAAPFGVLGGAVEEDGLADAAQADEQDALPVEPVFDAIEIDGGGLQNAVPSRQFRGRGAGAGSIRISPRVHS